MTDKEINDAIKGEGSKKMVKLLKKNGAIFLKRNKKAKYFRVNITIVKNPSKKECRKQFKKGNYFMTKRYFLDNYVEPLFPGLQFGTKFDTY